MLFNNRERHEAQISEIVKLRQENDKLKRDLSMAQGEAHVRRQSELKQFAEKGHMKRELSILQAENEKFQRINDELITKVIEMAKKQVENKGASEYKTALEVAKKELEQQARYTAELRSYISTLQSKVRELNVDNKHHKEQHTHYKNKVSELEAKIGSQKSNFDLRREKAILERRVSELYNAIDKIDDLVSEVI